MGKHSAIAAEAALYADQPNPREFIGANNPPADPFDGFSTHITDLLDEAKNHLDGGGVANAGEAEAVSALLDMLRKASKDADLARAAEKKPHDDAAKVVQSKWKPLLDRADLAMTTCKSALAPWLQKVEAEKLAAAAEARRLADEAARAAALAARMTDSSDLEGREQAEALVKVAQVAEKAAGRAEKDKAHVAGGSRAVGLRSYWTPALTDARTALVHYAATRPDDLKACLLRFAEEDVRAGKRQIPGFQVNEERRAV
jgi:hypothetical protein